MDLLYQLAESAVISFTTGVITLAFLYGTVISIERPQKAPRVVAAMLLIMTVPVKIMEAVQEICELVAVMVTGKDRSNGTFTITGTPDSENE